MDSFDLVGIVMYSVDIAVRGYVDLLFERHQQNQWVKKGRLRNGSFDAYLKYTCYAQIWGSPQKSAKESESQM